MEKKNLRRRSNWYIYLISFAATIVLLGLFILAFRDTLFPQNTGGGVPDWRSFANYTPEAELDVTVLFMMGDEQGSVPNNYMLLNYRPRDEAVVVVPINSDTVLTTGSDEGWRNTSSSVKITELYQNGGATKVIEGIAGALGVECDFYIHFDRSSFSGFMSSLGEVQVNIPYDFSGGGLKLEAGEHKLSGGDLFVYMNNANFPEADVGEDYDLVIMGTAITTLINSNCRHMDAEAIQNAFGKIRNNATTNLTFKDYTDYQRALFYTSVNSINPAIYYVPFGQYEPDGFVLSEQSVAEIWSRFKLIKTGSGHDR